MAWVRATGDHTAVRTPRVLLLKLAALGDVVMASTMIRAVRRQWPDAEITWAVGRAYAPLVRRFEGVDRIVELDEQALLRGGMLARGWAAARAVGALGRRAYDLAVVAHRDARYARLLALSNVRELRAMAAPEAMRDERSGVWMGEEYADLVSGPQAHAVPAELAAVRGVRRDAPARDGAPTVLLAPGGARNPLRDDHLRRWSVAHWAALARQLAAAGAQLTVIGGAGDKAESKIVADAASAADLSGRETLDATMDRIVAADLLITHDSGPMHLAQLFGTPVVALFGPTDPRSRIAPGADVTVASAAAGLPCAPCYDGRGYAVCSDNRCLGGVAPARVAELALARLAARA